MREYDAHDWDEHADDPYDPGSDHGDDWDPITGFTSHTAMPADAQLMGLDRNTEEGALVAMSASLRPTRVSHRIMAWLLLLSFAVPYLVATLQEIF
jgi:hypothetical protein